MVTYKNDEMHIETKKELAKKMAQYKCDNIEEFKDLLAKYNLQLVLDYENKSN